MNKEFVPLKEMVEEIGDITENKTMEELIFTNGDLKKLEKKTRKPVAVAFQKRKELEQRITDLTLDLKNVNNELELLSYSISHDLRAPLRSISGYALILKEDYGNLLDEEGTGLLDIVQDSAHKMELLINDVLQFSRTGRKTISKSMVNMNTLVKNTINKFKAAPHFKPVIKIGNLHPGIADYLMMKQVWLNVLSNAIKFSANRKNPVIEIRSENKNGMLIYSVTDNGIGFEMLYADKLFGVFQRLHNAEGFEGTGIGLALAHRIIMKHGGRIWAEAESGKGATFSFSLPEKIIK